MVVGRDAAQAGIILSYLLNTKICDYKRMVANSKELGCAYPRYSEIIGNFYIALTC